MRSSPWPREKLNSVCLNITDGKHGDCKNEDGSGFYFVSVKDIYDGKINYGRARQITETDFREVDRRTRFEPYDILITNSGTIGRMALVRSDAHTRRTTFQKSVAIVKPDLKVVDPGYLYYCIMEDMFRLSELAGGTTQKNLLLRDLRSFEVPTPPVPEQRAIAATLSCLDDKIELNNRMNKNLEETAQALFKSWFVDFDPVKAKMEGREPAGMDAETAALFPDEFEESELGPIPKGWRTGRLGEVVASIRQAASLAEIGDDCPYVGLEHIPRKSLMLESWGQASEISSQKSSFRAGNILFGKLRPYFHKVSIAPVDGICSTDILAFSASEEWYGFAVGHLYSTDLIDYATNLSQGTRMPRVNLKDISNYPVVLPGLGIASAYSNVAASWFAHMLANARQNSRLSALRDTLLPRLMSGEIRVPQAEEIMEEVL